MKKLFTWKNIFSIFLAMVTASQIIFPLKVNIIYANIILYGLLLLYAIYFITTKKKLTINYFLILYLTFVIISFSSLIWSVDFNSSIPIVIRIAVLFIVLIVIYNIIEIYRIEQFLLYGILFGVFFNFLIALEIINYTTPFTNHMRFTGTLARSNDVAIVMIIGIFSIIIINFEKKSKFIEYFSIITILLALYVILLTVSKKGILFGGILAVIYFLSNSKNFKKLFITLPIAFIVLYLFIGSSSINISNKLDRLDDRYIEFISAVEDNKQFGSTGDRILFIKRGIDYFSDNPIIGTGLNTFKVLNPSGHYSHNNYIEIIVGTGLIGLISFYLIHIVMFYKILKLPPKDNRKVALFSIIIVFLIMDTTLVSFSYKLIVFVLLFISIYIKEKNYV